MNIAIRALFLFSILKVKGLFIDITMARVVNSTFARFGLFKAFVVNMA